MTKTKPKAAKKKAKAPAGRRRSALFGDRQTMTVRMLTDLNTRLMTLCEQIQSPANTHVNGLIESTMRQPDPMEWIVQRDPERGLERVVLTLRTSTDLHERLTAFCEGQNISSNAFVCGLIEKDLRIRGL